MKSLKSLKIELKNSSFGVSFQTFSAAPKKTAALLSSRAIALAVPDWVQFCPDRVQFWFPAGFPDSFSDCY